jgi:hypothetical protein
MRNYVQPDEKTTRGNIRGTMPMQSEEEPPAKMIREQIKDCLNLDPLRIGNTWRGDAGASPAGSKQAWMWRTAGQVPAHFLLKCFEV